MSLRVVKANISRGLKKELRRQRVSQSELARRMDTSRAVVHRLLNPRDTSVTMGTVTRAATALGRIPVVRFRKP